jgi:hypothetical protein
MPGKHSRGTGTLIMAVAFMLIGGSVVGGIALANNVGAPSDVDQSTVESTGSPTVQPTEPVDETGAVRPIPDPLPTASNDDDDDDDDDDDRGRHRRGHDDDDDDDDDDD